VSASSILRRFKKSIPILFSEDEDAMDVDAAPKPSADDLAEYNLDDYDDDAKTTSKHS